MHSYNAFRYSYRRSYRQHPLNTLGHTLHTSDELLCPLLIEKDQDI